MFMNFNQIQIVEFELHALASTPLSRTRRRTHARVRAADRAGSEARTSTFCMFLVLEAVLGSGTKPVGEISEIEMNEGR